MSPERWSQIEEVYHSALKQMPEQRAAFLARACGSDDELRREVEALLRHGDSPEALVDRPAWEAAGELLDSHTMGQAPTLAGRRISHYEILEKIGEGGMGVVYKARDSRLKRFVALKVLPPEIVADAERKQRFVQEARSASALNHPNIVTVHDIDQSDGVDFIAMEYVEGKTLDELIGRKGLKLNEALKYAIQIADALAKAHAAGIVHRDVKPGNVMVTAEGRVKVLDFGLAKLTEAARVSPDGTTRAEQPTTQQGLIVGTVSYMSPEQAEGKKVDTRSDIFSFGSLLHEMVTGRRAFRGDTNASTLAAIISQEPAPLAVDTPHDLEKVITRCLRKDPARRIQHMDDVSLALEELKDDSDSGKLAGLPATARKRPWRWRWAVAAAVALLLAAVLVWRLREPSPRSDLRAVTLSYSSGNESHPSFSPDGNKVAFVWNGEKEDNYDIYIKRLGLAGATRRLTTSPSYEGSPTWSPDDRWIAFVRQQQGTAAVMLISPLGGPERTLTEMRGGEGLSWTNGVEEMSWTPDGKWLAFGSRDSPLGPSSIWAINVDTRESHPLTKFVTTASTAGSGPLGDYSPSISPDGRAVAFARQVRSWVWELWVLPLTRDLRPAGEPERVADQRYNAIEGLAWTANGREIVYGAGGVGMTSLLRVPVSGRQTPKPLPYALPAAMCPAVARTPPRLMYTWRVYNANLWRLDTRTGEREMLAGSKYNTGSPQYSPDGSKIAFDSNRSGSWEVWTCDSDGSGCQQLTKCGEATCGSPRWSPDGKLLALDSRLKGWSEIYVMAADGGHLRPVTNSSGFSSGRQSWSRNGRWIYFKSDRSGRNEIWKIPVAVGGGQAVPVTRSGGTAAQESPDGKYVYYVKEAGPGLFRMPAEGGEEKQVLPGDIRAFNFSVTARGIYVAIGGTIQFLDVATGKVSTLATLDKPAAAGLCVSPDEVYVVWAQVDRDTSDLMLVEGFR